MPTDPVPVIAVDGPSASGKGAVASHLAARLGYHLLDSGALYRVLGLAVAKQDMDLNDSTKIKQIASSLNVEFGLAGEGSVHLDREDVSLAIRTDKGSEMASRVGAIPAARDGLMALQLAFRKAPGLVADGRDMGTVVFPDAQLKIYLTASVEVRAQRRHKQLIDKGIGVTLPALLRELKERDQRDTQRSVSPLRVADDAVLIDSTHMNLAEVLGKVDELVDARVGLSEFHL